jgi:hypothetical protein
VPDIQRLEVRRFADSNLQAAIDRALAAVPADQSGAVVAHADGTGASLSVFARLPGNHWSIAAAAFRSWEGDLKGEVDVRFTWGGAS